MIKQKVCLFPENLHQSVSNLNISFAHVLLLFVDSYSN